MLATRVTAAASLVWLLQACGARTDAELIQSAKDYLAARNPRAASVQLKTLLQRNPDAGEARYLLGRLLLDGGRPADAEVELLKAADAHYDADLVVPALARAMVMRGAAAEVVAKFATMRLANAYAQAALEYELAQAYAQTGHPAEARSAVDAALANDPSSAPARLLKARLLASTRDFDAALALLDGIDAQAPGAADAWMLKGEILLHGRNDRDGALAAFRQAVALRDDLAPAQQAIVGLLVAKGELPAAVEHVRALAQRQPQARQTLLLQAQLAVLQKDYASARERVAPLLQAAPENALLLQLAGTAALGAGDLPAADELLAHALKVDPALVLARQFHAQVLLRTGQPERALEVLAPLLERKDPPAQAEALAGEAYLQQGDAARAERSFALAAKLQPGDAGVQTALALSRIGQGRVDEGVDALQSVAAQDRGAAADLALVATYWSRHDFARAAGAIEALEHKQPGRPLAPTLRGRLDALQGRTAEARRAFDAALALDPGYLPALSSLAALDLAAGDPQAARAHFDRLLAREPGKVGARLALAAVLARSAAPPGTIAAELQAAVRSAPADPQPRLQLVRHHLRVGDAAAALAAAQDAAAALPSNHEVLLALGQSQLAAAQYQQALTSFGRLAAMQPSNPAPLLGSADAYLGSKDYARAEQSLRHALELAPDLYAAQRALAGLLADDRRVDEAIAIARTVQTQRPRQAAGHVLEGDLEAGRRRWDAAVAAYRAGLQKEGALEAAAKLHRSLREAGRRADADAFAAEWTRAHPDDAGFRFYLGDAALAAADWAAAERHYRSVLAIRADNALAYNNLAWLLHKQSKPGALDYARKANLLQPGDPALRDTLAMCLAAEGRLDEALSMQKETVAGRPGDPALRLDLARLYLQAGRKAEARAELETLGKLGKRFGEHAEVTRLLASV